MDKKNYTVRVLFSSLFFSFFVLTVSAQTTTDTGSNHPASIDELVVKPLRIPAFQEVGGSPFMTTDFQPGSVTIAQNKIVANVPVRFNIFSNAVMIQKEGTEMKLENFQLVSYDVTGNDGSLKHVLFRQGYPEVDNHTEKSVYQVLSMGEKVHLLKFLTQKVEDAATLGDYSRRELVTTQQLYIYTPGGEMKKIKTSKQSLVEALPALSARIEELVNSQKLNLKNEAGITELVHALNKP
jgi:hypothetical protein